MVNPKNSQGPQRGNNFLDKSSLSIVGRKTGVVISREIQRDDTGMEDIDAFYNDSNDNHEDNERRSEKPSSSLGSHKLMSSKSGQQKRSSTPTHPAPPTLQALFNSNKSLSSNTVPISKTAPSKFSSSLTSPQLGVQRNPFHDALVSTRAALDSHMRTSPVVLSENDMYSGSFEGEESMELTRVANRHTPSNSFRTGSTFPNFDSPIQQNGQRRAPGSGSSDRPFVQISYGASSKVQSAYLSSPSANGQKIASTSTKPRLSNWYKNPTFQPHSPHLIDRRNQGQKTKDQIRNGEAEDEEEDEVESAPITNLPSPRKVAKRSVNTEDAEASESEAENYSEEEDEELPTPISQPQLSNAIKSSVAPRRNGSLFSYHSDDDDDDEDETPEQNSASTAASKNRVVPKAKNNILTKASRDTKTTQSIHEDDDDDDDELMREIPASTQTRKKTAATNKPQTKPSQPQKSQPVSKSSTTEKSAASFKARSGNQKISAARQTESDSEREDEQEHEYVNNDAGFKSESEREVKQEDRSDADSEMESESEPEPELKASKAKPNRGHASARRTASRKTGGGGTTVEIEPADKQKPAPKSKRATKSQVSSTRPTAASSKQKSSALVLRPEPAGLRRSDRVRIAPLQFWKNERILYSVQEGEDMNTGKIPSIRQIFQRQDDEEAVEPERKKKKVTRAKSGPDLAFQRALKTAKDLVKDDSFLTRKIHTYTPDGHLSKELSEDVILAWGGNINKNKFMEIPGSTHKLLPLYPNISGNGIASGIMLLEPNSEKSFKPSHQTEYFFFVVNGIVEVNISENIFSVSTGGSFRVPMGNYYLVKNTTDIESRLFMVQAKDTLLSKKIDATRGSANSRK